MDTTSVIARIDLMSGEQFECFICWLFQEKKYKVCRVGTTLYRGLQRRTVCGFYKSYRDFGADVIIEKDNERIAIQTKRCKKHIGKDAVKQVVWALKHYGCNKGLVISNNYFTQSALRFAKRKSIELWDRTLLFQTVMDYLPG